MATNKSNFRPFLIFGTLGLFGLLPDVVERTIRIAKTGWPQSIDQITASTGRTYHTGTLVVVGIIILTVGALILGRKHRTFKLE